jgi:flavin-dependent dehydrogenase
MAPTPRFQVVVAGGGPAGAATALALRRRGVADVLLVEAGDHGGARFGESVPPDLRLPLDALGLWPDFVAQGHEPCLGSCSVWGRAQPGYNDFLFNPHGHGWHLDRARFDRGLADAAVAAGAVRWPRTRVEGVERGGRGELALHLTAAPAAAAAAPVAPRQVHARFVVDATGSGARLARALGAARLPHDRLAYVAAFFEQTAASQLSRLTMLEAVEGGWWYAARLPAGRVAVALATEASLVRREQLHHLGIWRARLAETSWLAEALSGCTPVEDRLWVRTARSSHLEEACGPGWLAVGDAAATFDPIASRGLYHALQDGLAAAEAIAACLADERAAPSALAAYGAMIRARWAEYLGQRDYFYALERRWPSSPFWRNRRLASQQPRRG